MCTGSADSSWIWKYYAQGHNSSWAYWIRFSGQRRIKKKITRESASHHFELAMFWSSSLPWKPPLCIVSSIHSNLMRKITHCKINAYLNHLALLKLGEGAKHSLTIINVGCKRIYHQIRFLKKSYFDDIIK